MNTRSPSLGTYFGSLLFACLVFARTAPAGEATDEIVERNVSYPALGLSLTLPEMAEMKAMIKETGPVKGTWRGKLGANRVVIKLSAMKKEKVGTDEPDQLLGFMEERYMRGKNTTFEKLATHVGEYGFAPYLSTGVGKKFSEGATKLDSNRFYATGMLADLAYVLEVNCRPALIQKNADPILAFFKDGIRYEGAKRINEWTDDEAVARFERDAPEKTHKKFEKIVRTKHYIILTNSSSGDKFGKKMEECYKKIQKLYPFEEIEGRKLLPVFLFRTNEQYYDFCTNVAGWERKTAAATKGHAWMDYYATWYEAPNDPVHIHEATHQIFMNRLNLNGGGSWFQEGVAEYMESSKNERNAIATQVKKGRHMPLKQFFTVRTLAFEGEGNIKGGNQAGDLYKQAALVTEFFAESKLGKGKFQDYVHAMGQVRAGDLEAIEGVLRSLYDMGIDEIDQELQKYCKKR